MSLEDEVIALRARNKVLTEALKGVHESATKEFKKNFDLVWFARNRCEFPYLVRRCKRWYNVSFSLSSGIPDRFPNHVDSKRIQDSEEHREDLELLKTDDADYHHGFQAGVLAAARMFKEHSDILHINGEEVSARRD